MRGLFASTLTAILLAGGAVAFTQGQPQTSQPVPVRVQPPAAIDLVLFSAINAGKLVATTAANGRGQIDPREVENLGRLELTEEKCPDKTRVLLVAADGKPDAPPTNCRRRRVGAFWWGHDEAVNIRLEGAGLSTPKKVGIIAGAAVGAATGIVIATGGDDEPDGGDPTDRTKFNGTYVGTLPATTNTCPFSPTAAMSGVLNIGSNGQGTWQKTHTSAGITFSFTVTLTLSSSGTGSFTGTTSQAVGSRTFTITDQVSISGNTLTLTQTFTATSGTPCTVVYTGQLTRS